MTNEKQNEVDHWVNKLTGLDALPEATSGKDILWQHLQERLQQKPRRKKTIWYWAAACLLPVIVLPLLLNKRATNTITKGNVKQTQNSAPALVISKKQPPAISLTAKNKTTVVPRAKKNIHYKYTASIPKPAYPLTPVIEPGATAAIMPVPLPDAAVAIIAATPAKKKLPVVHINELGKQEQENAPFASHSQQSSFQIKLFNQDNYAGTPLPENNTATDMLKIKIPLKN